MKTKTVTVNEGEWLGPIDWSYDFDSHAWGPGKAGTNPEIIERNQEMLRSLEEGLKRGEEWEATTDGGWPRVGWGTVHRVGMYDGWPYWRPVPSVFIGGHLGGSWHSFISITEIRKR